MAGNQHWGHATSTDLYHWVNQPIALFPPVETQFVFSGSAVTDPNNTSGFFPDQENGVVAIYTLAEYTPEQGPQTQNIAYSRDGGYTFTPYEGNPVIPSESNQFRDPKVVRYGDDWVMVVAYPVDFEIGIFTSPDLINWTATSNFSHAGLLGLQYECPNLVEMPFEDSDESLWLMLISINPGAPLGGSIAQYFPGYFNGTHFTAVDDATRIADFGKDSYATQVFYGGPEGEDPVSISWASNWQYTNRVPTGEKEGFRSAMSLPRRNYLTNATRVGWTLVSQPYDLSPVLGESLASNDSMANGTLLVDFSNVYSNAVYFEVNVTNIPIELGAVISAAATVNFTFSSPTSGEHLRGGLFLVESQFFLDRGGIRGFDNPFFTDKFSTTLAPQESFTMSGVIDRSIFEVFLNDGEQSATATFFPTDPLSVLYIASDLLPPNVEISVAVYALESAWQDQENENGVVVGNVTEAHG